MVINRNFLGVLAITGSLVIGTPSYLLAGKEDRTLPSDREKVIEEMYSGSEEPTPPIEPSVSYENPIFDAENARGRRDIR